MFEWRIASGKSHAPVDRMIDGTQPAGLLSNRLEVARCCPSHCAAPAGESLSGFDLVRRQQSRPRDIPAG